MTTRGAFACDLSIGQSAQKMQRRKSQIPIFKPRGSSKIQASKWKCQRTLLEFEDWSFFGAWNLDFLPPLKQLLKRVCDSSGGTYLSRLMPKPISRSKTRKAVAKRFK